MHDKNTKTILLVDDEIFILLDKTQSLREFGYSVLTTNSGEKAVDLVLTNNEIKLVLMDIDLGKGIDGTEAAKRILAKRALPIMFHTAHTESEMVQKVRGITRYGYVLKTASPVILESTIEMAFDLFETQQKLEKQMYQLRQKEYLYRLLMNNVQEGVILVNQDDEIQYVNTFFCNVTGYNENELTGKIGYEILVKPDEKDFLLQKNANRLRGISEQYEITMLKKNGKPINFFMNASPVYDENGIFSGSMATCLDITEKIMAETKAQESEKMLRLILDTIPVRVFWKDTNSIFLGCNQSFAMDAGLENQNDLIGKNDYQMGWKDQAELYRTDDRKVIDTKQAKLNYEELQSTPQGNKIWLQTSKVPLFDELGECQGVLGTYINITDKKKMEDKVQEYQKLLRLILDTIPARIFIKDKNMRYLDCNLSFAHDAGLSSTKDIIGKSDSDLVWHRQAKSYQALGQEVMSKNRPLIDIEEPHDYPDGKEGWVKTNLIPLRNECGECIGLLGSYEDISERIQAQNRLLQSEITYRGIINSIEEAIYIQDEHGRFLDVNKAVENFYGYPREFFIGKTPEFISAGEKNNLSEIMSAIQKAYYGTPQHFEFWGKQKDGNIIPKEVFVSQGTYFGEKVVIAVARNISERIEKEKQIYQLLQEKETLLKEVHHRIKNNMNIIRSLLSLQIKSTHEQKVISALQDAQSRVQSMMVLYDKLYRTTHFKNISTQDFFSSLVDEIISIFPQQIVISINKMIEDFNLEEKKISALGIILSELLTNAMKYAFQQKEEGTLSINLKKVNTIVQFTIQDNGDGFPKDYDKQKSAGFGLKLVRMLTEQLNGNLFCESSESGSKFVIEFPFTDSDF
jgi:PAS domain S-box-containing protein